MNLDVSVKVPWLQPLTVQCGVLKALTCLSRLELHLLPRRGPPWGYNHEEDDHMDILAGVLFKNPRIRTLHIDLNLKRARARLRDHKYHNVPLFGHYSSELKDLHLEGDLSFMMEDWVRWDAYVKWTNLTTLQLTSLPLVLQVLAHCAHRLPNLDTLQIRGHRKDAKQEEIRPLLDIPASTIIKDFLSSTSVIELDLTDFTRDFPLQDLLVGSGGRLRRLRLHVNLQKQLEGDTPVSALYWGESAFLSSEKLDYLNSTCPQLEHLGLDAEVSGETFPVGYKPRRPLSQFDLFHSAGHCLSLYLRFADFVVSRSSIIENPNILSSRERLLLRCSNVYAVSSKAFRLNV